MSEVKSDLRKKHWQSHLASSKGPFHQPLPWPESILRLEWTEIYRDWVGSKSTEENPQGVATRWIKIWRSMFEECLKNNIRRIQPSRSRCACDLQAVRFDSPPPSAINVLCPRGPSFSVESPDVNESMNLQWFTISSKYIQILGGLISTSSMTVALRSTSAVPWVINVVPWHVCPSVSTACSSKSIKLCKVCQMR